MTIGFYGGSVPYGNTRSLLYSTGVQTARSASGYVVSYTMPASTLAIDSDYIVIDWMVVTTLAGSAAYSTSLIFDGTVISVVSSVTTGDVTRHRALVIRTGTNTITRGSDASQDPGTGGDTTDNVGQTPGIPTDLSLPILIGGFINPAGASDGIFTNSYFNVTLYTA